MSGRPTVVFRADASAHIGAGHITRCLSLADIFSNVGWRCVFASIADTVSMFPVISDRYEWIELAVNGDEKEKINSVLSSGCDLLVIDHYGKGPDYESCFRSWAKCIFVIDDLNDHQHECDFILNQSTDAVNTSDTALYGPLYALLRAEFRRERFKRVKRHPRQAKKVQRLFLSLGATDPGNYTVSVLDALADFNDINIDVALSSAAPHLGVVRQLVQDMTNVSLHIDAKNIAALMAQADIAIGAAGVSSWERCCLGLPAIVFPVVDNQECVSIVSMLDKNRAAITLDKDALRDKAKLIASVKSMIEDLNGRIEMSLNGMQLCDGRGAWRILLALQLPMSAKSLDSVTLRLAEVTDKETIFSWQCAPETRRYARNPNVPSWQEHDAWFELKISDPDCIFMMIMAGDASAGVLRLDLKSKKPIPSYEISILIDPARYGSGLAQAALRCLRVIFPGIELHAIVLDGNEASHALFRKAGFVYDGQNYILAANSDFLERKNEARN